jgi:hypothetical protein
MIVFKHRGNFDKTEGFCKRVINRGYMQILDKYAREGVAALASATPVDSGETANSWNYEINVSQKAVRISWTNSHVDNGVPVAIVIQYGHATRNGGYIQGRDYINPAIQPIFDKITDELWKGVTNT